MIDNSGNFSGNAKPTTILTWLILMIVLFVIGYKLSHPNRSHDQQVLIDHSKH